MKKFMLVVMILLFVTFLNCNTIALADNPPPDEPIQYDTSTLTIKSRMFNENGSYVYGHAWLEIIEDGTTTVQYNLPGINHTWTYTTQVVKDPRVITPTYEWRSWVCRSGDAYSTHLRTEFYDDDTHVHIYSW